MNFDIEAIESLAQSTYDLIVDHKDGPPDDAGNPTKGDPVGFRVLGSGSNEYQKIDRAIRILNVQESAARRKMLDSSTDEGAALIVDSTERRIDMLIEACVVDWFGFTIGDKPAGFSKELLRRLLKAKPSYRPSIVAAIEDDANFTGG